MFHTHIGDINWRNFTKSKHLYPKDANEQAAINKNLCDYIAYLNRRIDILCASHSEALAAGTYYTTVYSVE